MAIDPKKMEAWLNQSAKGAPEEDAGGEGMPDEEPMEPTGEEPEDEEESPEEDEAEGELEEKYPTLYPLLEEYGEMIESTCDTLDPELLKSESSDWDDENQELLEQAVDTLPMALHKALKKDAKKLKWDDAQEIAEALEAGDHIQDAECVGGFLYWAAQTV